MKLDMEFDFEGGIASNNEKKVDGEWKTAKYRKGKYGNKENKTLLYLRKGLIILLAAYLLKMGGQIAYEAGYNSDFAQHFWDDTKEKIKEEQKLDSMRSINSTYNSDVGGER